MAHLHAPSHQPDPNHSYRRPPEGQTAQSVADSGATPAVSQADAHLLTMPNAPRQSLLLHLQRQLGNRHVQGLLAQQTTPPSLAAPAAIQAQAVPLGEEEESAVQMQGEEEEALQMQAEEEEELQMQGEEEELQMQGEEEESLQMQAEEEEELQMQGEEEEEPVQMQAQPGAHSRRSTSVTARIHAQRGAGTPLDTTAVQRFSGAFGQSFDNVRVHTDSQADGLSRDLGARAFTNGNDIFFRSGTYAPGTTAGDHLIAHELTHVVQQGKGLVPTGHQSAGGRDTGDSFEQEAQSTADAVSQGQPLPGTTAATASVQRKPQP